MRRLIWESVVFDAEGGAEMYFADDDLFWGHSIIVSMSPSGEFHDACLAG